jgi:ABC-type transporter Mla maintaining outer membrane lipid asymmetry ATPase subunit MlaF
MLHKGKIIADGAPDWFKSCDDPQVRRFVDGHANPEDLEALDLQQNGKNP